MTKALKLKDLVEEYGEDFEIHFKVYSCGAESEHPLVKEDLSSDRQKKKIVIESGWN